MNEKLSRYREARNAYYNGTPIMSDAQFDALEEEIRQENPNHPALKEIGAPLPKGTTKKATHLFPMGSQEKVNSFKELQKWQELRANDPNALFHASLKGDGGSVALIYRDGLLTQAITRGDGQVGEDITHQAALFKGIPLTLPAPLNMGVACEAILTLEDWATVEPEKETNPRNVATGILGRLDSKKAHFITLMAFGIFELPNTKTSEELTELTEETARSLFLEKYGFQTLPWKGHLTLQEVQSFFQEVDTQRKSNALPFWIDGVIVRYESLTTQEDLGYASNRPKGQVAWKFLAEAAETQMLSVDWQVGHSGAITPVAQLQPVRIGGTTVSKASLANTENIATLGAFNGALVEVVKAGDIIPMITKIKDSFDPEKGHTQIEIPTTCPICSSTLEKRKNVDDSDSVVLFCHNRDCEGKTLGKIKRFCKSRDIQGLGDSVITALVTSETVRKVPDLYRLTPEALENTIINTDKNVRLGRKRAEAICAEIQAKGTKMSLVEFLGAFGTRNLGVRRATLMAQANPELQEFENWFNGKLLNPVFAQAAGMPKAGRLIHDGLIASEEIIRETRTFVTFEKITAPPAVPTGGQTICITGSLPSGKRKKDYSAPLEAAGHRLVEDLTKDVTALVLSNPNGPESTKTKKAAKLGIPLKDEAWLISLISAPTQNPETETHKPIQAELL